MNLIKCKFRLKSGANSSCCFSWFGDYRSLRFCAAYFGGRTFYFGRQINMQFNVVLAREIYKKLCELECEKNPSIDVNKEAILFTKALYIQLYGERIIFCEDKDFFVSQTPTGYAVTGYYTQANNVRVPFNITINKADNNWSPSVNYVAPDTKSVSCSIWLWLLLMAVSSLFGLISYLILKTCIGF